MPLFTTPTNDTPQVEKVQNPKPTFHDQNQFSESLQYLVGQLNSTKSEVHAYVSQLHTQLNDLEKAVTNTKIPQPFRIKFKNFEAIPKCRDLINDLVTKAQAYEDVVFSKAQGDKDELFTEVTKLLAELDNTIKNLPSNKKIRKIGLAMGIIGTLVAIGAFVLFGISAAATIPFAPIGATAAAISAVLGCFATTTAVFGFGLFFGKNGGTTRTGINSVERVRSSITELVRGNKIYSDELLAQQNKPR